MISPGPRNSCKSQLSNRLCSPEMLQLHERLAFPCDQALKYFITLTGPCQAGLVEAR